MASTARASRSRVDDARASTTLATRRRRRRRRRRASLCRASSRRRIVVSSSSRGVPRPPRARARSISSASSIASGRDRTMRPMVRLNGYTRTTPIPSTSLDSRTSPSTPDAPRPTSRDPIRARRRRVGVVASARHSARPGQRALERPNARSARDGSERTESAPSDRARHAHRRARVRDDDDVEREV